MRAGTIYRRFVARNGHTVTLRALKWEDLDEALGFVNSLVEERDEDPNIGIVVDKKKTRDQEAEWLANALVRMENGDLVSVAAEVDGRLVGNGEVNRGRFTDMKQHGTLGISVVKEFRNLGIGTEMMKTLIDESRKTGLKSLELEVFGNNPGAIHVYEKVGFKQVGRIPKKIFRKGRFIDAVKMAIEL